MKSDEQVIQSILSGDNTHYRDLVSRYQHKVYSVALKITNNQKDAEDISQEVFIKAFQALSGFQSQSSFSTWLYKITVNRCLDWKRKYKAYEKEKNTEEIEMFANEHHEERSSPEEALLSNERSKAIGLAIQGLPKNYQSVISLYYFNNMTYQQIADKLGIAKKTVESRLYRGKMMLKERWVKEGYDEL